MYRPGPGGPNAIPPQPHSNQQGPPGGQYVRPPPTGHLHAAPPTQAPPFPNSPGGFQPRGYPQSGTMPHAPPSPSFGAGPPQTPPPVGGMQRMSLGATSQSPNMMGQSPAIPSSPNARPAGFMPGPMSGSRFPPTHNYPGSMGGPQSAGTPQGPRPQPPPVMRPGFPGAAQFSRPGQPPPMMPGPPSFQGPPRGPPMTGPPSAPGPAPLPTASGMQHHQQAQSQPGFQSQQHMPRQQFGAGPEPVQSPSPRIDPNQIPRPSLEAPEEPTVFETRATGQHQLPMQACSSFISKDTGNCSPHHIRLSYNHVPATSELVNQVGVPLVAFAQPLAPQPMQQPIQVVNMGEDGPIRCGQCRAYINPFVAFQDGGRTFQCPFCSAKNEVPASYFCYLGPDGRRRDADERPELCYGTVEYTAPPTFSVRPPMPPTHFFLIDVSYQAVSSGAMRSACRTVKQLLKSIQGGERAMAGIATFDGSIHFYSLKSPDTPPAMLVVPDTQEAFAPVPDSLLVPVQEYAENLEAILDLIPQLFSTQKSADNCAGVAIEAAVEVMKHTGGKLHCILCGRPTKGARALQQRDSTAIGAEKADKEKQTVLIPQDNTYRSLAIKAADFQVCVDLFILTNSYVDVATLCTLSHISGGTIYRYAPYHAQFDDEKFFNDLRWNLSRPQGLEAVLRMRCSAGLEVESYLGACYLRTTTDVDLPAIDCDKSIMVKFRHDEKLQEGAEACFQCALLYTTTSGERRIRVSTLAVSITGNISQAFRGADLECCVNHLSRKTAISLAGSTLAGARETMTESCVSILHAYRQYCATPSSSSGQLILPDALKLLPLYVLSLIKSVALRSEIKPDDRSIFLSHLFSLPCSKVLPLLYGRLIGLNHLGEAYTPGMIPSAMSLSSEHLKSAQFFLLENGHEMLLKVEPNVPPEHLKELVGLEHVDVKGPEPQLLPLDNKFNRAVHALITELRKERGSFMRLRLALRSFQHEQTFLNALVEDRNAAGMSYVEYLCHVHRGIQGKMK